MAEKEFKEQIPVKKGFTEQVRKGGVTENKNPSRKPVTSTPGKPGAGKSSGGDQ